MLKTETLRLIRKLMVLSVLVLTLSLMSSGMFGGRAMAAVSCQQCEDNFDQCQFNCPDELPHGCNWCNTAYRLCIRNCTP